MLFFKEPPPKQKKGGNEGEEEEEEEGEAMVVDEEPGVVSSPTLFLEVVLTFERVPRAVAHEGLPRELLLQESGRACRRCQKGLQSTMPS